MRSLRYRCSEEKWSQATYTCCALHRDLTRNASDQALGEGYEVFIVTDASGGVTAEAHDMAVSRMVQAGAIPINWMAVLAEWQRDWARTETTAGVSDIILEHGGASAVALAWELQLLATNPPVTSGGH